MSRIQVNVGGVRIGGGAPISIQSMTNTDTRNAEATVKQILELENAGAKSSVLRFMMIAALKYCRK
ncbi:MAG: flavodoxin-dependent (E)-4-hydroxy-3-methylbut-2-enyl-diphosphate synthase [Christensenellales bacterium]